MKPYSVSKNDAITSLDSSYDGLSSAEAEKRLLANGKNELKSAKKRNIILKFLDQFKDAMIIVLLAAAVVSAVIAIVTKEYADLVDSGIILIIVLLNAIIGLTQEQKAEAALDALKNMNKPYAKVIRDGELTRIPCENIVVGDIVVLEAGDMIPADIRLIESISLTIEEAALTGESVPSEKNADIMCDENAPLGDRKNMAHSSGVVSYGRGRGIVTSTGMNTEVGKIATMLSSDEEQTTPLQKQLAKTAKILSVIVLSIAAVIFVASILRDTVMSGGKIGDSILDSFMTAVAIAVAAIPEGLPAVVTIVLALGVQRMSKKNAIIKNLPAVETLGCCEVICSDKTGTLTLNKMTVKELFTLSDDTFKADKKMGGADHELLTRCMVLCNDTIISENKLMGDPTETALVAYAQDIGVDILEMNKMFNRVDELPFDSERKLMTTVNGTDKIAYTKGAPDLLIDRCGYVLENGKVVPITQKFIARIKEANSHMAEKALRVLAMAIKYENTSNHDNLEKDLIFVGLAGMIDPPRPEVKQAVATCKKAGMRAIMITGDHAETASAIAREIGILHIGGLVITGAEMDKMSDEEFMANLHKYRVFARVSPENKVRIVKAFKKFDIVVAMTGDGVNDAPSIKAADIGVGMGITGTDVSKGVADMVLADDNFATIIAAVEEGRKVYSNITKAIQFLLSANTAEVLCLFIVTVILSFIDPSIRFLTPVMILWVNLVTDSLPALALGMEKAEPDIMAQPPRKAKGSMFSGKLGKDTLIQGFMQTALVMASYCLGTFILHGPDNAGGMTMAFITLSFIQLFHAYNMRSQTFSILNKNIFSNKLLNISFLLGVALVVFAVFFDSFAGGEFFGAINIPWDDWLVSIACSAAIIPMVEVQKVIYKKVSKKKQIAA